MIQAQREELLKLIAEMSELYPDWRLGQLLINLSNFADAEAWDVNDEQLISAARKHLAIQSKVHAA